MSRTIRGYSHAAFGLLVMVAWAGCDAVEGPPPIDVEPPSVRGLQLEPPAASVDTLAVQEGRVTIPLMFEVEAEAGDQPLQRVAYAVQWQFECVSGRIETAGEMEPGQGASYLASPVLDVPFGRRGAYRVTAWAVDAGGRSSNEVSAAFVLTGTNLGPPVIDQIEAPAEVHPPATLRFVVRISDPDGVDHIARAEVDLPGGGTLPLADTDTAGNNVACDGTYSATFGVPAGVEPGPASFVFRAFDRDGAVSQPVPFTVEILP